MGGGEVKRVLGLDLGWFLRGFGTAFFRAFGAFRFAVVLGGLEVWRSWV